MPKMKCDAFRFRTTHILALSGIPSFSSSENPTYLADLILQGGGDWL
jgi:hypothetical protein